MTAADDRKPPVRVRVTGLQEAHLLELMRIETELAQEWLGLGVPTDALAPRSDRELARLVRDHDVYVLEADHQVAGYLAWQDQSPGVAMLGSLTIAPPYRRFGLAMRLCRELGEVAQQHGVGVAVATCYARAAGAMAFLAVNGFMPIELTGRPPEPLGEWLQSHPLELFGSARKLWWASTDGLGTLPGLPRPSRGM